ncbi:MAG TPA: flagellar motor switch protein FliN [Bosea sp. (in: a-proteobacteria)]|jgi:flagellar motor switch protein FliN/FliY|uniref:flagellar motor switch protein FliN n=1 Tax=Bosea sp. (in: a-proteobacteria) TaxID=1871050 RepID=UPI002DDD9502|nr:flagellar motor switch protein FliN [Bosea sp. (in: a-proteobacteria)]HEV2554402.1 flagellar motor switch protein FliN [Bosea sp. (in: a-proteobacteria)]
MKKPTKPMKLSDLALSEEQADVALMEPQAATEPEAAEAPPPADDPLNLEAVMRIPVTIQVVLGSASMQVANLMKLRRGAVVPLDHRVGEPVDVVVNGRIVARGEVVIVEDDNSRFGVSLTEIVGVQAKFEE